MGVIYKFRGRELGLAIAHSEPIVRAAGLVSRQTGRLAGRLGYVERVAIRNPV